jgi:type II secretory pathway component PulM
MDYLRNITTKQWLIILAVIIFFVLFYFIFFRTPSNSHQSTDLEILMQQSTAPARVDETVNREEVEALMKQGEVAPSAEQPINKLSEEQKDELLKLMSAPSR